MDENVLRGLLILPVAFIGSIFNWTVVIVTNKIPTLNHSFGFLTVNQAFGDAVHSTAFLIYMVPMLVFNSDIMKQYSYHCGFVLLFCYELSVQTHFFIAINRFLAAFAPIWYNTVFSDKITKVIISIVWLITVTTTFVYYEVLCHFYYTDEAGALVFTESTVCFNISWYTDFGKYLVMIIIIVGIDISTVIKVRYINSRVRGSINRDTIYRKSKKEMNFLKQTVFQGSIFALELLTYFVLPIYMKDRWTVFISTSFAWVAVHAADGVITIICNPEFKKYLQNVCKGENSVHVQKIGSGPTS